VVGAMPMGAIRTLASLKHFAHCYLINSGKTHSALQSFAAAESSVYLGPLRLLAHEVYERMNKNDVECNLLTGEDRKESSHVTKWACTIEMAPLNKKFDVAVIDEIQVIADRDRGSAWTNALLGLQASKIHICGEESAVDLVQDLCNMTGDKLTVQPFFKILG
jgi:ATP-dependent RNA helicase SUPV3L1/SUV3